MRIRRKEPEPKKLEFNRLKVTEKLLKVLPIILASIIIVNLVVLDFFWIASRSKKELVAEKISQSEEVFETPTPTPISQEQSCSQCLTETEIESKIDEKLAKVTPVTSQTKTTPTPSLASSNQIPKVSYVPLGGSSSTSNTDWTDISGSDFYFNKTDYPGTTSVSWEVSLHSFLGGNKVYSRLYDVTNKRAVDGGELSTDSSSSILVRSGNLTIWSGNNLYRIQAKSSSGTPANLDSPRLKITL